MSEGAPITVAFAGRFGEFHLDTAFTVPAVGVTAVFGPSGCGKTTVLRCVAGLHRLPNGTCRIGDENWQEGDVVRPTHRRPIGYVFQDASLFPHLSVRGNLMFGARGGPPATAPEAISFDDVVDLLCLAPLLDRSPRRLSGGERQRVAIGRALLSRPKLLLMDEPLSALDREAKDEIILFLERVYDRLSIPTLYVTHDMTEVERLADHLVLMRAGRVLAAGPLQELQSDPTLPLLASRDAAVSLDAVTEAYDPAYGLATLRLQGGHCLAPLSSVALGERRRLRIAAGDVSLTREHPRQTTIVNILPARILSGTPTGEVEMTAVLGLGADGTGARLLARVTRRSWDLLGLRPGDDIYAQVKGVALVK